MRVEIKLYNVLNVRLIYVLNVDQKSTKIWNVINNWLNGLGVWMMYIDALNVLPFFKKILDVHKWNVLFVIMNGVGHVDLTKIVDSIQ